LAKKSVKTVTEPLLKREIGRLEKSVIQALRLLKGIDREVKNTSKATSKITEMQKQLIELRKQVAESAKAQKKAVKKPRKLTEMNLFVKEQIKSGKSFAEAIQAWKDYKATKQTQRAEAEPPEKSKEPSGEQAP